jgi:C_GCAxxG_C_C family probable redox protein
VKESDIAVEMFRSGCACSQAVLAPFAERYGLSREQALRVAAGFAGGMRRAETCGAVTGGLMVLGLAHCGADCDVVAGRKAAYEAVIAFSNEFREREGGLDCKALLGCDVSTPEGARAAQEANLFRTRCVDLVRQAADLVARMTSPA